MSTEAQRAEFEAWCKKRWGSDRSALTLRLNGEYQEGPINFAWAAWQAAQASQAAELAALKAENEALRKDAGKLRQMLGMQWCSGQGVYPYTDDGQFFDGSVFPTIDFMADSPDEIEKKFVTRMKNAIAERMKSTAQEPPAKRKYVRKAATMQTKEAS